MEDNFDLSKLKKKKRLNSKNKGNTFQRKVAGLFNERFKSTEFCPTPGSGAFATTHTLPDYLKIHGDLITPKDFSFCLELKFGYNKENLGSLFNSKSEFWSFIDQVNRDSKSAKKEPLLIFRQNNRSTLCVLKSYSNLNLDCLKPYIKIIRVNEEYIITELSNLFQLEDKFFFGLW